MDRASTLTPGLLPLPRPLMAGEVLDAAFRLFRASLLRCLPYSGFVVLLLQLPTLYSTLVSGDSTFFVAHTTLGSFRSGPFFDDRTIVLAVALLVGALMIGALLLRMHAISRGARPRFRVEAPVALRRWPAAIVVTLIALIFPVILAVVGSLVNFMFSNELLFVIAIPLLWPTAILAPALPAFWCDGLGPFAAIARSVRIARRRTWRLVGAIFTTLCIVLVFYALSALVIWLVSSLLGRADLFLISAVSSTMWIVFGTVGLPFVLAVLLVAYEDLKLRDAERRGEHA